MITVRILRLLGITSLVVSAAFCGTFQVSGRDPGPWPAILRSAGFVAAAGGAADVWIVRAGESGDPAQWALRAEKGAFVLLEGESAIAAAFGFRPGADKVRVASVEDKRQPLLDIIWEQPLDLPVFSVPGEARVFATERWRRAPLIAGFRRGAGGVLWVAASPGTRGYERFPYLLHALADLGLVPPFHSRRLWAFFDSSYRSRVDLDYFARRWRAAETPFPAVRGGPRGSRPLCGDAMARGPAARSAEGRALWLAARAVRSLQDRGGALPASVRAHGRPARRVVGPERLRGEAAEHGGQALRPQNR